MTIYILLALLWESEVSVQKFLQVLLDRGYIYKDSYDGWYCRPDETYFTETQVRHHEEERRAKGMDAADPEHPLCPDCDRPLERIQEETEKVVQFFSGHHRQRRLEL